jgi:hypothetical protein
LFERSGKNIRGLQSKEPKALEIPVFSDEKPGKLIFDAKRSVYFYEKSCVLRSIIKKWIKLAAFVYIMTNRKNGTLYTGSCIDLIKRVYQHKEKYVRGFTQKYNLSSLVYFEEHYQPLKKSFNLNAGDGSGKLG